MDAGETPEQVIENFWLHTTLRDVLAVYNYAKRQLSIPTAPRLPVPANPYACAISST